MRTEGEDGADDRQGMGAFCQMRSREKANSLERDVLRSGRKSKPMPGLERLYTRTGRQTEKIESEAIFENLEPPFFIRPGGCVSFGRGIETDGGSMELGKQITNIRPTRSTSGVN
ncbi:hypothetical protein [Qipengyuania sp. 902]|uniref:hypothetical protein n=1 Tax=Qipengyuania sp. 902 TaxID=3417565 RepID=UPI003EB7DA17